MLHLFYIQATCVSSQLYRWSWVNCSERWGVCELSYKIVSRRTVPSNNWSSISSWSRSWGLSLLGLRPFLPSLPALREKTSTDGSCYTVRQALLDKTQTQYCTMCEVWPAVVWGAVCPSLVCVPVCSTDPAPSPPVRDIGLFNCGSPGPPYSDLDDSHSTANGVTWNAMHDYKIICL